MKSIIIFNLLVITSINLIVNAHENHEHQIYSWPNSKNKSNKAETTINFEKLEDKNNKVKNNNKINWTKILRR